MKGRQENDRAAIAKAEEHRDTLLAWFEAARPRLDGAEIPQRDFPRYETPWGGADFPLERLELRVGGERLVLPRRSDEGPAV